MINYLAIIFLIISLISFVISILLSFVRKTSFFQLGNFYFNNLVLSLISSLSLLSFALITYHNFWINLMFWIIFVFTEIYLIFKIIVFVITFMLIRHWLVKKTDLTPGKVKNKIIYLTNLADALGINLPIAMVNAINDFE
ncbi:hypothetical protein [Mycoplasma phage sp.]|uniref:Uncharacterized protein n=1 Tax=Mycoplasmopsis anatis 1340 TaxID=1034808 RepID=F9QDI8_9BACT|nr:hypothetical protein [Mycoplasmopsis anatis]EGS29204.1 hypothetical protein GIG_02478 [Mycoplasmopsis anatis 1340]QRI43884.1 hypothetical protein [Mycoplasma phage sp.]QRI43947.1 hypothetical protein [Mycoplasma phage sp.]QRI43982.1 hypothetical protein [Mycoplasma phage sp.]VEU73978.1 Uncharacterised protein [Mycoplasmopsis anatis]